MKAKNLTEWRNTVLERDKGICQIDGELANIADHIIPGKLDNNDILLETDNGRALCHSCHAKYGTRVYRIKDLPRVDSSSPQTQPERKPINWHKELEITLLNVAGALRTSSSLKGETIQEFLPGNVLVLVFEENGCSAELL